MLQQIRSAETALIATLKGATAALDAAAGTELDAALNDLKRAADGAKARLDAAADKARGLLLTLAREYGDAAARLPADLSGPAVPSNPSDPTVPEVPAADSAPATAPSIAQDATGAETDPAPASEAQSANSIDVSAEVKAVAAGEGWAVTEGTSPLPDRTRQLAEAMAQNPAPVPTLEQVEAQVNARHQEKPKPAPSSNGKAPRKRR
jgi:hypothetical protein